MDHKQTDANDIKSLEALDALDKPTIAEVQVTLDVGGVIFKTYKSTLVKAEYFANIFKHNFKLDEVVFVDRNPKMFYYILEFLRIGIDAWLDSYSDLPYKTKNILVHEADFFTLGKLKSALMYLLYQEKKRDIFRYAVQVYDTHFEFITVAGRCKILRIIPGPGKYKTYLIETDDKVLLERIQKYIDAKGCCEMCKID